MIDFIEVSKGYGGDPILDRASVRINAGDRVGIVGPNGAGKSTLFALLTGQLEPDRGEVGLPKDIRIGYLHQQLPAAEHGERSLLDYTADAIPELRQMATELHELEHTLHETPPGGEELATILARHGKLQSAIEQLGAYSLRSDAEAALCNLGFHPEELGRPLKSFSGGWQMRASLARVLIARPDLLLLDEPSNYLDIPAVEYLCRMLNGYKGTLLLISHDRFLLRKLTSITLEVNQGKITRYPGDYDYYRTERENRRRNLEAAKRNTDRKKEHLEKVIDRFRAKSSKAAQAKSWQKALDKIDDVELMGGLGFAGAIRFPEVPPCGTPAADLEGIDFGYSGHPKLLKNVNLRIENGDKIAFVGYNGTGKTTLLKLLVGKLKPDAGRLAYGHQVKIGYQAQEFSDVLDPEQSVYDVVRAALDPGAPQGNLMNVLGSFGFSGDAAAKRCGVLSGGEKIRLCFARIFVNPPNLLVLDEPTTHLDINARELLQNALRDYKGTVCVVSHDIEFVRAVATTIVAMEQGTARKYFGTYDYYLEKAAGNQSGASQAAAAKPETADQAKERRRERARRRAELAEDKKKAEKKVAKLESEMAAMEARQAVVLEEMAQPRPDFAKLNRELTDIRIRQEMAMEQWEAAAQELEEILKRNAEIHED